MDLPARPAVPGCARLCPAPRGHPSLIQVHSSRAGIQDDARWQANSFKLPLILVVIEVAVVIVVLVVVLVVVVTIVLVLVPIRISILVPILQVVVDCHELERTVMQVHEV